MKTFFWIDLEMTGLDEKVDHILEVAVTITQMDLHPLETFHRVVHQPAEVLAQMNDWCKKAHKDSGLASMIPQGMPLAQVEAELLSFTNRYYNEKDQIVLAGNSVGNDRRFIEKYLPAFAKRLHYRLIDVSSFKEVFREKYNLKFEKKNAHRATDDILESIRELKFYLSFVQPPDIAHATQT